MHSLFDMKRSRSPDSSSSSPSSDRLEYRDLLDGSPKVKRAKPETYDPEQVWEVDADAMSFTDTDDDLPLTRATLGYREAMISIHLIM
jgi:hypothetical protein